MGYWSAKHELEFMEQYKNTVIQFWNVEHEVDEIIAQVPYPSQYMSREEGLRLNEATAESRALRDTLREKLVKDTLRANSIASKRGAPVVVASSPAPMVGGPIIRFYLFDAILRDPSHGAVIGQGVEKQTILDGINATIGQCEQNLRVEWKHLINPFYWLKVGFVFILRLPVNLIGLAGFNIAKFEEHFWGKFFNLIWIAALIAFLLWLGLGRADLADLVKKLITKG